MRTPALSFSCHPDRSSPVLCYTRILRAGLRSGGASPRFQIPRRLMVWTGIRSSPFFPLVVWRRLELLPILSEGGIFDSLCPYSGRSSDRRFAFPVLIHRAIVPARRGGFHEKQTANHLDSAFLRSVATKDLHPHLDRPSGAEGLLSESVGFLATVVPLR